MEERNNLSKYIDKYFWLLILCLSIPAAWALFVPGYFGASDDLHIAWLYQMDKVLRIGQIPPRFVPDLSFGYGYPLFNFVFPLPFYIGEIFHLMGISFVDSVKAVFLISIPLSGMFMYLFLKEFLGKILSLTGAVIYIYTPYRAVDLYIRGAIGEIFSFVFLPMVLLSILKLSRNFSLRWLGIGGLSIGGLVLTHNITSYMFLPTAFLLGILLVFGKLRNIVNIFVVFLMGALISLYFWFPALTESSLVKYDTVFNFIDHFPTLRQLVIPYWGYGASVPGPYDGLSFNIGLINLILAILGGVGLLVFWKKFQNDERVLLIWGYLIFLISIFLMNFRSSFLWEVIPNLAYFQFPWRFLILTTFLSPIFLIGLSRFKYANYLGILILLLVIAINYSFFKPQDFLGRTDEYYLKKYTVTPNGIEHNSVDNLYLTQQEEYLRLPINTSVRPWKSNRLLEDGDPQNSKESDWFYKVNKINDLHIKFETKSEFENTINVSKYLYPGWIGLIDGNPLNLESTQPFGQISARIPSGNHVVEILFTETPFKKVLDIISLIAVISALIFIWNKKILIKK